MLHGILVSLAFASLSVTPTDQTRTATFDSAGVTIRYATAGQGEPIILVHGWMGDATMWGKDASGNPQLTTVPGFQAIAIDCRGHGQSGKPHDRAKYGAEMANDVLRLMDHLKLRKAHLIGYSMGAFVVGKVAATRPGRVLSIIYGGQAPLLIGESGSREIDVFAKLVEEGKELGPYLVEFAPPPKLDLATANAIAKSIYAGKDLKAWAAAGKSFNGLEVKLSDLQRCKAPVLFIQGSLEAESTQKRVKALRESLPNTELKVLEGSNHVTALSNPQFGTTIVAFLLAHRNR